MDYSFEYLKKAKNPIPIGFRQTQPGSLVRFTHNGEWKVGLVISPDYLGKLHVLSLKNIPPNIFSGIREEILKSTTGKNKSQSSQALYRSVSEKAKQYDAYRSYKHINVRGLSLVDIFEDKPVSEIRFSTPNFNREWEAAANYDMFVDSDHWKSIAGAGKEVSLSVFGTEIKNTDYYDGKIEDLETVKVRRFSEAFNNGLIEMPIVVKYNGRYELLAGNVRLVGLKQNGISPDKIKVWYVDLDVLRDIPLYQDLTKEQ